MRILLVEDDRMIGRAITDALNSDANAVDWLRNGQDARYAPTDTNYDCILLDLGLPHIDGVTLLKEWRNEKVLTPIIILTARDGLDDRVQGLDNGADDYLVKPFDLEELRARIRAVTRRVGGAQHQDSKLRAGDLTLDPIEHELYINENGEQKKVTLTAREFSLLEALMLRPGAIFSRESLEDKIYSFDEEVESNAIEYIIHTLRKKIGAKYIKNVRGVGWKIVKDQ